MLGDRTSLPPKPIIRHRDISKSKSSDVVNNFNESKSEKPKVPVKPLSFKSSNSKNPKVSEKPLLSKISELEHEIVDQEFLEIKILFEKIDKDNDGFITLDDLIAYKNEKNVVSEQVFSKTTSPSLTIEENSDEENKSEIKKYLEGLVSSNDSSDSSKNEKQNLKTLKPPTKGFSFENIDMSKMVTESEESSNDDDLLAEWDLNEDISKVEKKKGHLKAKSQSILSTNLKKKISSLQIFKKKS